MPVVITCPACGKRARVPSSTVGKTVRCRRCDTTFAAKAGGEPPDSSSEADEAVDSPAISSLPPSTDRQVERTGVGLLALGEAFLAFSLTLQLIISLVRLVVTPDVDLPMRAFAPGPSQTANVSIELPAQWLAVFGAVLQVGATVLILLGAVYAVLPAAAMSLRAAGGCVFALALAEISISANSYGELIRNTFGSGVDRTNRIIGPGPSALATQLLVMSLTPLVVGAGLEAMLAVFARSHARRQRDRVASRLAGGLAIAYPAVVVGVFLVVVLAGISGNQAHPTFDQTMMVLDRLFRTVLVAAGAFVLWRVWTGLTA